MRAAVEGYSGCTDHRLRGEGGGEKNYNIFFFSSRRRHTISKRDWSSDVCSSDLDRGDAGAEPERRRLDREEVVLHEVHLVAPAHLREVEDRLVAADLPLPEKEEAEEDQIGRASCRESG